ncbi:Threonine/homoserine/homoserine lactone efflux protein [Salinimicrobium catena]|uniref:Threonine/homoserine/homoserine lactone efflux protein n=1 Tax=Salinimicrobium catena TaxID=390640 RepID=A0A1H5PD35_9FLAO|nr:LysE family translocator [Salinimicrobium catena]SDL77232.1 Threonine/homoserine/homoserine lactone efflux protein [Salinimicrobium catena]SEF11001.1 Threonine/homoserine/homoserine lactone efflux protein [Salinimicrobium catena]
MLEQIIPFLTASILLTISPGPDIIYVLVQGMTNGKKYGVMTAFGLVSGIIVHTSLVAFGISAILKQSEILFLIIKLFGAGYLLYLAYQVYKSDPSIKVNSENGGLKKGLSSLYKRGFLMNVLNPKVAIFFLAFFPGFLWEPSGNTVAQFYLLGFLFMLQAFLIFSTVAVLAGKISGYLQKHPHSGVVFKWLQVIVFLGIAGFILI